MSDEKTVLKDFKKNQPIIGFAIIVATVLFAIWLSGNKAALPVYLGTGVLFGYILTRSRFGFAGGIKRVYILGEGSLTYAILIMLGIGALVVAALHWGLVQKGATSLPGMNGVKFANISTVLGGFLFGIGMILAGGCASGTLSDLGEGEGRSLIAFVFFVLGSPIGHYTRFLLDNSAVGKIGAKVYFPDVFGYAGALLLTCFLLLVVYWLTRTYEKFRKEEGHYRLEEWIELEKPLPSPASAPFFSFATYHKFFVERWSFMTGGILLVFMAIVVILTTGRTWGVTSAFSTLGVAIYQGLGWDYTSPAFTKIVEKVNGGLLNDGGTIRNIGIVIGATLGFLLAGRFIFNFKFKFKDAAYYILGGFLMGFGARLANGCNIGALFSAIIVFSLSGWIFFIAITLGGIVGLKLFAGKVCIIPPSRYKK